MKYKQLLFFCMPFVIYGINFSFLSFHKNFTDYFEQEQPLMERTIITVQNIKGSITIKPWSKKSCLVTAQKTGSQESLKLTKIDIQYTKSGINIKTIALKFSQNCICTIDYTIFIPESTIIESVFTQKGSIIIDCAIKNSNIKTLQGSIALTNVQGTMTAETVIGPITLTIKDFKTEKIFASCLQKGTITLYLPKKNNWNLEAQTKKGKIMTSVPINHETNNTTKQVTKTSNKKYIKGIIGLPINNNYMFLFTKNGNVLLL